MHLNGTMLLAPTWICLSAVCKHNMSSLAVRRNEPQDIIFYLKRKNWIVGRRVVLDS